MPRAAVVDSGPHCFGCARSTISGRAQRAKCVRRQRHRASGPIIPHACSVQALRQCKDCFTLVVG